MMPPPAPVFVVTADEKFIRRVDESGSHRAPWVRHPEEILPWGLPISLPWGHDARRFSKTFEPSIA
jgi:hypothetical protein